MSKKIKVTDLPEFDIAEHLDSEQAIAEYLSIVLEEGDSAELAHALSVVARARGNMPEGDRVVVLTTTPQQNIADMLGLPMVEAVEFDAPKLCDVAHPTNLK